MRVRSAFTMIELVFVIVIIGILSSIAIPKFAATRDDAIISKARSTVASIRSGLATLRQKNILRADFSEINASAITDGEVLEYGLKTCKDSSEKGCWVVDSNNNTFTFRLPDGSSVQFDLKNNRFVCHDPNSKGCELLTR